MRSAAQLGILHLLPRPGLHPAALRHCPGTVLRSLVRALEGRLGQAGVRAFFKHCSEVAAASNEASITPGAHLRALTRVTNSNEGEPAGNCHRADASGQTCVSRRPTWCEGFASWALDVPRRPPVPARPTASPACEANDCEDCGADPAVCRNCGPYIVIESDEMSGECAHAGHQPGGVVGWHGM